MEYYFTFWRFIGEHSLDAINNDLSCEYELKEQTWLQLSAVQAALSESG